MTEIEAMRVLGSAWFVLSRFSTFGKGFTIVYSDGVSQLFVVKEFFGMELSLNLLVCMS